MPAKIVNIPRRLTLNFMIVFFSLFTMLVILEAVLRLFPFCRLNQALTPGTYISHPTRRYALQPNFSGSTYGKAYKINSLGLRDKEYTYQKQKGIYRILAVGDSCIFGSGLELGDTYPKQLERMLQRRLPGKKIEVLNCGVPSYNTAYEYLFLKEEGLKYFPDLVIISYIYNDSVHNYPLTSSRYRFLNTIKDNLRKLHSYEFILDKVYRLNYMFRGLVANNPEMRRENLKYVYSDSYIGWQENKKAFGLLVEFSQKNNIPIVYVIYPKFEKLKRDYPFRFYHQIVGEALKDHPYVLDLLPYFEGRNTKEMWVTDFDSHPSRKANAIIAEAIADFLVSKGLTTTR